MDKPEDVSVSSLRTVKTLNVTDAVPHIIAVSHIYQRFAQRGGNILRGCQVRRPQLQTGVDSESARLAPAPLFSSHTV